MQQLISSQHGDEPNPLDNTGLCLLSLDGGGVRGLSTLYILKSIMDRLNHEREKTDKLPPVKPCEVFDLIGGTSTGGLIAIMLGRLEMDVDECITAYSGLAAAIFGEKSSYFPVTIKGQVKPRFDTAKLEKAIRKVIAQSGASETELLNDGNERGCKTLRSYSLPDEPNIGAMIYQAALATSAATTFFAPMSIGNRSFADGGLGANNPVDEIEGEASNIWCSETGDLKPLVKCFISIGTGNPGKKAFEDSMIQFLGQTVVEIATETENTERKFMARWAGHFDNKRYFRFNVDQGLQDIGLDEYKKAGAMEAATSGYITHPAQKFRVRDCIQNLRLKQNQTDTSFATLMNKVRNSQHHSANEALWIVPFDRNPNFTGREALLADAENKLFFPGRTTKCAIWGLGGVGKTQLLLELLYRMREKRNKQSIIWISATSLESLQQGFLEVATKLGIPGSEKNEADAKKLVQQYLSKESAGQWILVFDNADTIDMWITVLDSTKNSDRLIDYLPRSKRGSILFTTRDRKTAVKLARQNIVEVLQMDESTAQQLLEKSLVNQNIVEYIDDTKALLRQLANLPLAITQAAAYINENSIAIADYLSLLNSQEDKIVDLLSENFEDDGRYLNVKNPVATTWLISFEQIRHRDPLAAEILSFMACVDPKDIPQSLLPPSSSPKKELEAIGTLDAYSFIQRRPRDLALDIHRLVHLATRNWLQQENMLSQWTERAVKRLSDVFPHDDHRNRSIWRRYLTHTHYALDSNLIDQHGEDRVRLAWKFGNCLGREGRWKEAEDLLKLVMETRERVLGHEHPDTLISMANLASTYRNQGRLEEAEDLQVLLLETCKRVLGHEHPDTLSVMSHLAWTYRNQGRLEEAEDLQVLVSETGKRVLGHEHPDILISMANLATTYQNQGRLEEAEDLDVLVLETSKRVLGHEHPDTLISMANLASTFRNQGRWKKAEDLEVLVLETSKRVLGHEHPDTLTSMANLASIYRNQGRWKKAEDLDVLLVEMSERVLGHEHPDTLTSMANLATTYQNQGRWKKAEDLEVLVLETRKRVLGHEHPDTLISMANLASTYWNQGRLKEAEDLQVLVLEMGKRILGHEHPNTLISMANLATTYRNQGRWKKAEDLDVLVLETSKRVLGHEHPDTLVVMSNLALTFWNQGRLEEAEDLQVLVSETGKRVLGHEHPDTLTSMANLALTYWSQGRLEEAEDLQVLGLETRKRVLGHEHPDTLIVMSTLAFTWKQSGRFRDALELLEECEALRIQVLGVDHPDTKSSSTTLIEWRKEFLELQSESTRVDSDDSTVTS